VLKGAELQGSMGRVAAGDNAAMELFFSLLQKNGLDRRQWETRDQRASEIIYWIGHTYNRRRQQRALRRLTRASSSRCLHATAGCLKAA
jgi:putative transposase